MMVRTQIQLTEEQHQSLRTLALRRGISLSELVRQAMERVLAEAERENRWDRVMALAGKFEDPEGQSDVSARHDEYLGRIWADDAGLR